MIDYEFYETPGPLTAYMCEVVGGNEPIHGKLFEPCVGNGAIGEMVSACCGNVWWQTGDLDPRWKPDRCGDATTPGFWGGLENEIDWVITNPPFSGAIEIADHAIRCARVGVVMHLRASIHEVLKTGRRRTWMREHRPAGIIWLPRVAYQRSRTTGKWTTDSVTGCWVVWLKDPYNEVGQFIDYADQKLLEELDADTPAFRRRSDELCGYVGSEIERQRQHVERWKGQAA